MYKRATRPRDFSFRHGNKRKGGKRRGQGAHGQAKQVSSEERARTGGEAEDTRNRGQQGCFGKVTLCVRYLN